MQSTFVTSWKLTNIFSDAQLRTRYNHRLQEAEEKELSKVEPIVARQNKRPGPLVPEPLSILRSFKTVCPSFDEMG
jgi:hypothetical protein